MRFVKLRAFNATLWGSLSQGKKLYKIISLAVPPSGRQRNSSAQKGVNVLISRHIKIKI